VSASASTALAAHRVPSSHPTGRVTYVTPHHVAPRIHQIIPAVRGTITEYSLPTVSAFPRSITAGSDGNVWFVENGAVQIGKITPDGTITEYPANLNTDDSTITNGPDGNLWFTAGSTSYIGKITTSGVVTTYPLPMNDGLTHQGG